MIKKHQLKQNHLKNLLFNHRPYKKLSLVVKILSIISERRHSLIRFQADLNLTITQLLMYKKIKKLNHRYILTKQNAVIKIIINVISVKCNKKIKQSKD